MRVAVIGYGNVGRHAVAALQAAPDLTLAGVVRRSSKNGPPGVPVVSHLSDLGPVDAAILAVPTRQVATRAKELLSQGIHTVDSFDLHGEPLLKLRQELHHLAETHNAVSILAAGWDPGSDSIIRTLFEAIAPKGITYTNFGPGMSMGHSTAVKAIEGVTDALSITLPQGQGLHRRTVYVSIAPGADFETIKAAIKNDPYFINDETLVYLVDDVASLADEGHGVLLERKGGAAGVPNQLLKLEMRINNPALTAQMLVAAVRAAGRQKAGCYTLPEIPVIDLLPGPRETWLRRLV